MESNIKFRTMKESYRSNSNQIFYPKKASMTNFPFLSALKIRKRDNKDADQHRAIIIRRGKHEKGHPLHILPASAVELLKCHVLLSGACT